MCSKPEDLPHNRFYTHAIQSAFVHTMTNELLPVWSKNGARSECGKIAVEIVLQLKSLLESSASISPHNENLNTPTRTSCNPYRCAA